MNFLSIYNKTIMKKWRFVVLVSAVVILTLIGRSTVTYTVPGPALGDYQMGAVEPKFGTFMQDNAVESNKSTNDEEQLFKLTMDQIKATNTNKIRRAFVSNDDFVPAETLIMQKQRKTLKQELKNYKIHSSLGTGELQDLVMESNGRPVRNMVITTWRSGSTFLGDVLLAHPGTYYHYEPLLDLGIRQARYGELADIAVSNINNLMKCNYIPLDDYLNYGIDHPWLLNHNSRLWWVCFAFQKFCLDKMFLSNYCKLFPFQSIKTVRLRMNLTEPFLRDPDLDVRVLLLVRDPRGTLQSRKHRTWCPGADDCDNPERLCEDLVSDYYAAQNLTKLFPGRVRVIRYEDLSFDLENKTRSLFDFFRLSYVGSVEEFLQTHTKFTQGGVSSTFRDSKKAPVHWRTDLSFNEVDFIQKRCQKAMSIYGYIPAIDSEQLVSFNPIGEFQFGVT